MHQTSSDRSTKLLGYVLKVSCVIPFATGLADTFGGTRILSLGGAKIPLQMASDPVVNSQIAFWGAVWFGYGLALWWVSNDVAARAPVLRLLLATLLLSGLARAFAAIVYGWAGTPLTIAMLIELAGSLGLFLWLSVIVRSGVDGASVDNATELAAAYQGQLRDPPSPTKG